MREVAISGIGIVSAIGTTVAETLESIYANRSGIAAVNLFTTSHQLPVGEVKLSNNELMACLSLSNNRAYTRTALLAMLAAKQACNDARLQLNGNPRIGLISSTSVGGMDRSEQFYTSYHKDSAKGRLRDIIGHDCADSTEALARYLGVKGFVTTLSTACSSAANAIMLGARMIKSGMLDYAIVGGADSLCRFTLNGFSSLMITDSRSCRPFDADRKGLNLGEGAAYLVLQNADSLEVNPYGKLSGYANANDAHHQTASSPEGKGSFMAMEKAINVAGIKTNDIDYINVHGTGTENNDSSEGAAICRLFGSSIPPLSSTKPFTGHTLGAAGGIEAVLSVLAIKYGLIYPNLNFTTPIPELNITPELTLQKGKDIRHVMSNSFGFGGNCSSLIFSTLES